MSWSFDFVMPCCGIGVNDGDINGLTWNLMPMMDALNIAPREQLHDKTGKEIAHIMHTVHNEMMDNPDKYTRFNPENGWGSYENLKDWCNKLLIIAVNNPKAILKVS
jgi:hypothetical protein